PSPERARDSHATIDRHRNTSRSASWRNALEFRAAGVDRSRPALDRTAAEILNAAHGANHGDTFRDAQAWPICEAISCERGRDFAQQTGAAKDQASVNLH